MGLMALNLATLNVNRLSDPGKCTRLLGELKNFGVDAAAVQETHFTCSADCHVLESDFNVFSAHGSRTSMGVSLPMLPLKVSSFVWLRCSTIWVA